MSIRFTAKESSTPPFRESTAMRFDTVIRLFSVSRVAMHSASSPIVWIPKLLKWKETNRLRFPGSSAPPASLFAVDCRLRKIAIDMQFSLLYILYRLK